MVSRRFLVTRAWRWRHELRTSWDLLRTGGPAKVWARYRDFLAPELPSRQGEPGGQVLFVSGCPGDSMRLRCFNQAEQLRASGVTCDVRPLARTDLAASADRYDLFILQRVPMDERVRQFLARCRTAGKPTLFETDDLIFDERFGQWAESLQTLPPEKVEEFYADGRRYRETLLGCQAALVSTEYLAEEVHRLGKPAYVNRNAMSDEFVRLAEAAGQQRPASDGRVRLGYVSGSPTHEQDFAVAERALLAILKQCPHVELHVVGYLSLGPAFDPYRKQVVRFPVHAWEHVPARLAALDVNLAPLVAASPFCRGKSELKYLEAAFVGVPTLASRIDSYAYAIEPGANGLLAGDDAEWEAGLRLLVERPDERRRLGEAARQHVLAHYRSAARAPNLLAIVREVTGGR